MVTFTTWLKSQSQMIYCIIKCAVCLSSAWQCCPTTVSSGHNVCVLVEDAYSGMLVFIASWQNIGHGGAAAAWRVLTWTTPKSITAHYNSIQEASIFLVFLLLASFIFIFHLSQWIFIFLEYSWVFPCLFHLTLLPDVHFCLLVLLFPFLSRVTLLSHSVSSLFVCSKTDFFFKLN